jgi:hypothetical protein
MGRSKRQEGPEKWVSGTTYDVDGHGGGGSVHRNGETIVRLLLNAVRMHEVSNESSDAESHTSFHVLWPKTENGTSCTRVESCSRDLESPVLSYETQLLTPSLDPWFGVKLSFFSGTMHQYTGPHRKRRRRAEHASVLARPKWATTEQRFPSLLVILCPRS